MTGVVTVQALVFRRNRSGPRDSYWRCLLDDGRTIDVYAAARVAKQCQSLLSAPLGRAQLQCRISPSNKYSLVSVEDFAPCVWSQDFRSAGALVEVLNLLARPGMQDQQLAKRVFDSLAGTVAPAAEFWRYVVDSSGLGPISEKGSMAQWYQVHSGRPAEYLQWVSNEY